MLGCFPPLLLELVAVLGAASRVQGVLPHCQSQVEKAQSLPCRAAVSNAKCLLVLWEHVFVEFAR